MTYDDTSMGDYVDDIDTMLVFAALFSAVVATFAVQTYQSQDSTLTRPSQAQSSSSRTHLTISYCLHNTVLIPKKNPAFACHNRLSVYAYRHQSFSVE
ncbi:hypothetical protein PHLGIDRAFT_454931 [Phlebiopsis gigantea 11061_1 CR5-6]|uniref:DUF6535 domain-containing protein n=1 Tax=Phlebiopsis gigantea (strain 11061_1 CR5-6) TaxID=745531 RepID=A0A0C3PUW5_PHLG1|nr:hypothetical protein PHLGIDRAFT_454931 [Phlebiopsis gigantea 11061_1 CR5-6]